MRDFRSAVRDSVIIGDGAMATWLHQLGAPVRTCHEALCVHQPEFVRQVHKAYLLAGADLIQTNTFSAHRPGLERYGLEHDVVAINQAAVVCARDAIREAGREAWVFGTVGSILGLRPQGIMTEDVDLSQLKQDFSQQMQALLDAGVDGLILETFADVHELLFALDVAKSLTHLPIVANLAPKSVGVTRDGTKVDVAFAALLAAGADVVGLNCDLGPSGILRTYEAIVKDSSLPGGVFSAVPNAGMLQVAEGDYSYTGSASYFADIVDKLYALGVHFIGGCCGTTPEHISQAVSRLKGNGATKPLAPQTPPKLTQRDSGTSAAPQEAGSAGAGIEVRDSNGDPGRDNEASLIRSVSQGLTVMVELDPPKHMDITRFLRGAKELRDAGADFLTMADNSLGTVRVSNMALASILKAMGIEPLVHVACRDRNLIGQQSHLMGLHVLGVHHILLITGDPSRFGDLPGATSVYDVSSIDLTRLVKRLNAGIAFSGETLKQPARFTVGTAFNPNVRNFDKAIDRLKRKVAAGADYVMTQPVFDEAMFERIATATEDLGVPVFIGIMPLVSQRNAAFLHNEVPGIEIPQTLIQRMMAVPPESAAAEGLRIAEELLDCAVQHFRGIYLITPFLRYDMTVHLTKYLRSIDSAEKEITA